MTKVALLGCAGDARMLVRQAFLEAELGAVVPIEYVESAFSYADGVRDFIKTYRGPIVVNERTEIVKCGHGYQYPRARADKRRR